MMVLLELLGALLIAGGGAWPVLRALISGPRLGGHQRRLLYFSAVLTATSFVSAFFVFRVCAERLYPSVPFAQEVAGPRTPMLVSDPDTPPLPPLIHVSTVEVASAEQIAREEKRQDRYRGYQAGHALATDPQHRGGKVPRDYVVAAIATVHGKGKSADFVDGFCRGYVAGLTEGSAVCR